MGENDGFAIRERKPQDGLAGLVAQDGPRGQRSVIDVVQGLADRERREIDVVQADAGVLGGLALAAVTTTSRDEVDWITEFIGRVFPREWDAFAHASGRRTGQRVVDAYFERLTDPDDEVRDAAAAAWCAWEDVHVSLDPHATPDPRYQDRDFRNRFATHVVNSWAHSAFLGDRGVLDNIERIAHLPVVLIHGRLDVSSPLSTAWELHQTLPLSELVVIESEGHGGAGMTEALEVAYEKLFDDWAG